MTLFYYYCILIIGDDMMKNKSMHCENCKRAKPFITDIFRCMDSTKKGFNFTKKGFCTCDNFEYGKYKEK